MAPKGELLKSSYGAQGTEWHIKMHGLYNEFPNLKNISDTLFNNTNLSNVCTSVYSMFFICDKSKLLSRIITVSRTDSSSFVTWEDIDCS